MNAAVQGEVQDLLNTWPGGHEQAVRDLIPLVYGELRKLAHHHVAREGGDHTLNTTALVHELWLRVQPLNYVGLGERPQFFGLCAQIMRHILVDHARSRNRAKRGRDRVKLPLADIWFVSDERREDLIALNEALHNLSRIDARKARVVELRFFAGLNVEETAAVLHVSPETIQRDWRIARIWLARELAGGARDGTHKDGA